MSAPHALPNQRGKTAHKPRSTFKQYHKGSKSQGTPRLEPLWYNPRKVAQIIAYFANEEGGKIPGLKVVKLAYLADRRHMQEYAHPLFQDNIVSMAHGPVHSITYNFINGTQEENEGWNGWKDFVKRCDDLELAATKRFMREELDELSDAEMGTLEAVWKEFGNMDGRQIRDWTHKHCPEWEDPGNSSAPIPHERIFKHLGYDDAKELAEEVEEERRAEEFWVSP